MPHGDFPAKQLRILLGIALQVCGDYLLLIAIRRRLALPHHALFHPHHDLRPVTNGVSRRCGRRMTLPTVSMKQARPLRSLLR